MKTRDVVQQLIQNDPSGECPVVLKIFSGDDTIISEDFNCFVKHSYYGKEQMTLFLTGEDIES